MSQIATLTRRHAWWTAKQALALALASARTAELLLRTCRRLRPDARGFYYPTEQRAFAAQVRDLKARGRAYSRGW